MRKEWRVKGVSGNLGRREWVEGIPDLEARASSLPTGDLGPWHAHAHKGKGRDEGVREVPGKALRLGERYLR